MNSMKIKKTTNMRQLILKIDEDVLGSLLRC